MNLDDPRDRVGIVEDLIDHVNSIVDSMENETDMDIDDYYFLRCLNEKLFALRDLLFVEGCFGRALYDMDDIKQSDEDSKWTFPLEKEFNWFGKKILVGKIDVLVDCSRSWPFEDYRARNFQDKLRQKMEMLRDWYKEEYGSDDDE